MERRAILASVASAAGLGGGYLYLRTDDDACDVACFEFSHQGFDNAPDVLTITHAGGRDLPANEVYITNVVTEHGSEKEWTVDTVRWHEVDEGLAPTDGIRGASVRVDIEFPDVVQVLWRSGDGEQVLDETRSFR